MNRLRGRQPVQQRQPCPVQTVGFLNTTGDVLNATEQDAFESYINGGGGYVGVHAAADTETVRSAARPYLAGSDQVTPGGSLPRVT